MMEAVEGYGFPALRTRISARKQPWSSLIARTASIKMVLNEKLTSCSLSISVDGWRYWGFHQGRPLPPSPYSRGF